MPDPVFERIDRLLKERGESQQHLLTKIGMNRWVYSSWKQGKSKSYLKEIVGIANFLDVSPDYLLRGIEDENGKASKAAAEDDLIRIFRQLDFERQECLIQVAQALLSEKRRIEI